ncbi:unnamed protein product [Somion occarium]|uniref:Protein kinase domain-containing protein n=1 Tax=Somion occarium TaxID=3059160 RepID=A0ABP1E6J2_9APHY
MARLSDFGLAVFAEGMSKNYASVRAGADHWLGPELLDPERFGFQDDRPMYAGDIYSFGCMCLELYTGQDPFLGLSHFAVAKHVTDGHRPPRPSFHEHVKMADSL